MLVVRQELGYYGERRKYFSGLKWVRNERNTESFKKKGTGEEIHNEKTLLNEKMLLCRLNF